jgi:molybdenum cofactor cytidylyltransferase
MKAGPDSIAVIVLAAGSSTRLGQSKQLVVVKGKTLLENSIQAGLDSGAERVVVVLGAQAIIHKKAIEHLPVEVVVNEDWKKGMGNSLKTALQHVISNYPKTEAVVITVCDQPYLTSDHLRKLISMYHQTQAEIIASVYCQTKGVPALFSQSLFDQLFQLAETEGARKIIQDYPAIFPLVEFPNGDIDLDTPEDLSRLG